MNITLGFTLGNGEVWMILTILTSAVKRLKYLIAINRIYVIVNSKLIAINRKFVSILNVPSFIYFLFYCPYQHGKVDWLALCKCFILLKTNIAKQGGTKYNYKVHISGKQGLSL